MALRAGRKGVNRKEVDYKGNIKNGGSTPIDAYTKTQTDALLRNKVDTSKIGGLEFRENDGVGQYKLSNGEWVNFNSGGIEDIMIIDLSTVAPTETQRSSVMIGISETDGDIIKLFDDNRLHEEEKLIGDYNIENISFIILENAPTNREIGVEIHINDVKQNISIYAIYNTAVQGLYDMLTVTSSGNNNLAYINW